MQKKKFLFRIPSSEIRRISVRYTGRGYKTECLHVSEVNPKKKKKTIWAL